MTKVECPGPGFKGLKWKWIQDHAKEQQEREKERVANNQQAQVPGLTPQTYSPQQQQQHQTAPCQPLPQPQQPAVPNSSAEPQRYADPSGRHVTGRRQSRGGCEGPQQFPGNAVPSQPGVKVEAVNGWPGPGPDLRASPTGCAQIVSPGERARVKEEQESKARRAEPFAIPAPHAAAAGQDDGGASLVLSSAVPATGAAGVLPGAPGAAVVPAAATGVAGTGISPTLTLPAVGPPGRKSTDLHATVPAASIVLSPVAAASAPVALPASAANATHFVTAAGAAGQGVTQTAAPAAVTPSCALTPPSAPAHPAAHAMAAAPQAAAAPYVPQQPPITAPSSAPPPAAGAPRTRLPPTRGASMTVASSAAVQGGDDFEAMFTPLSSLPTAKSETPRAGGASRAGSLVLGQQPSLQNAASGPGGSGGGGGTAGAAPHDAGAQVQSQAVDRKGPLKKASRTQDGRINAGQPQVAAASAPDQLDGEQQGPSARGRTTIHQTSVSVAAPTGASKDAAVAAAAALGIKAQPQPQLPLQPHGQSQPTLQPQAATQQQQPSQQQQRVPGSKPSKDGAKLRESGEGASSAAAAGGSATAGAGGGSSGAGSRGGVRGERSGAPVSAGSTPAAASVPAHSGEAGERKRPRSEGSKPKGIASLMSDAVVDTGWETLADRIKRAKRATTSSSDHEGPASNGGSAERLISDQAVATAANAGNAATGDVLDGSAAGAGAGGGGLASAARGAGEPPPRPAVSAEAQSRGAEASTAVPGSNPSRGPQTAPAAATGPAGSVAGPGSAGAHAKPQQQQRHPPPPPPHPHSGGGQDTEKFTDQSGQNLRVSGGGAVTDSSGGGGGPPQRAPGPSAASRTAAGMPTPSGTAPAAGGKRAAADLPPSSRRDTIPSVKFPRSDPHLPRPHQPHGQARRGAGPGDATVVAAAAATGNGRGGAGLPPAPASRHSHRASSGHQAGRAEGGPGSSDGRGAPNGGTAPGQAAVGGGPPPLLLPQGRPGRLGESDMRAAGSYKGPAVAGSRGSKDGACDKGACGPRHGGSAAPDGACGPGGGGGAGAAATTTTEPKTDSDTRTSRLVECFFEFDAPCRLSVGPGSISGLGSSGSLQVGHGLAARLGATGHFIGGGPPAAAATAVLPRDSTGGGAGGLAAAQLLDLGKICSFKELWTELMSLYDGILPDEMDSKLIYLDEEGDWIMVTPDEPWSSVAAAATKVLVTNRT